MTPSESDSDAKRRLEGIVESAMDAIITVDERQEIVLFNPAAEQMFGVRSAEALGQPLLRFIPHRFHGAHDEHIRRFRDAGVTNRRMGALGAVSGLRANGEEFPVEASISLVDVGGEQLATVILRDITERKQNEEARVLLAREVDHRAKNALAVAQSLVTLTRAETKDDYARAVRGRIAALARAHSLLSKGYWQGADLGQTLADEADAYSKPGQALLEGPKVTLESNVVQPFGLVIHELATNAFKYGALSRPRGRVAINWRIAADGALELDWVERGGPAVKAPTSLGFGSTLLHQVVTRQLAGRIETRWRREGVQIQVRLPPAAFRTEGDRETRGPARAAAPVAEEPQAREAAGRSVLVVEDESLIAMELAMELADFGWRIVGPAASLNEGLRIVGSEPAPSVAVLDVNLGGRSVYPLAEVLREHGVPFVFCTGYELIDAERFRDTPVLRKPVNMHTLNGVLDSILAQPQAQETAEA